MLRVEKLADESGMKEEWLVVKGKKITHQGEGSGKRVHYNCFGKEPLTPVVGHSPISH